MFDTGTSWHAFASADYQNFAGNANNWTTFAYDNEITYAPGIRYVAPTNNKYASTRTRIYWKFKDWTDHSIDSNNPYVTSNNGNIAGDKVRVRIRFIPANPNYFTVRLLQANTRLKKHKIMSTLGTTGLDFSAAVPETFDVPSATVPAFTRVSYQKSNRAQAWTTDWHASPGAGQGGATMYPRGGQLYGIYTAMGVGSEHGYHWRIPTNTNNVTTYQGGNYNASDVNKIVSPPSPIDSLAYTGQAPFGANLLELNSQQPNIDPVTGQNAFIFESDKISLNNVGYNAPTYITQALINPFVIGNWYLVDVVLEAGTTVSTGSFCYRPA